MDNSLIAEYTGKKIMEMKMQLNGLTIWQQASGDNDRNYTETCLTWGVILNGPGHHGAWPAGKEIIQKNQSSKKVTDLNRFYEDMKDEDIVVLRRGTSDVYGVGIIRGEYQWNDAFGDVDGWDLQHVRRVDWKWKSLETPKSFPVYTLKLGDTTQVCDSEAVLKWIVELNLNSIPDGYLPDLSNFRQKETAQDEIMEYLFDKGTANGSIENLVQVIDDLQRIARWYLKFSDPSEFETEAYLIVPLFRALGWTPQRMAIEWHNIDIALFDKLPRSNGGLIAVVEAKKKGYSCLNAKSQAMTYAKDKLNCNRLIVSDGLRYGVFLKKENEYTLHAYMNLTRFRDSYPIYDKCEGIMEALWVMTPDWKP